MLRISLAFALLLTAGYAGPQSENTPQKLVSPDAYKRVPARIRRELTRRHCQLPETQHWDRTLLNIVTGQFGDAKQQDWAALCITPDGALRAFVFWGGISPCSVEIPARPPETWFLRGPDPGRKPLKHAGSLYLLAQSRSMILGYRRFFGDNNTSPVTHEGVEVGDDQSSQIHYCYRGRWLTLAGND